ncbi:unnamed protein product [Mytilus edulis]|uniref:Uncharacterized protein n=1 Tax=Mytilus edulis TaxID=6550 RepID=A0A8S3UDI5_MYTED|nr:unnamed protein product [Mytilus edulis]
MSKAQHNVYVNNIFDAEDIQRVNVVDKSINDSLSSAPDKDTAISNTIIMESTPNDEANQSDNPIHNKQALLRPLLIILVCILVTAVITYFATKTVFQKMKTRTIQNAVLLVGIVEQYIARLALENRVLVMVNRLICVSAEQDYTTYFICQMMINGKSNVKTAETSRSSSARFSKNKGTISDYTLDINELIYYEVNYTFTLRFR